MIAIVLKLLALSSVISLPAPAARVVVPVTTIFPLSVIAPAVVTFKAPAIVDAPRSSALLSTSVTLRPEVIATVEKLFPAESSVISLPAPAARVVAPVTLSAPLCVSAPLVVTFRVPEMVEAPRTKAFVSRSVTLFALLTTKVLKLFPAESSVMSFPVPAAAVVVPVTTTFPLSVIAPVVVTFKAPETVDAPRFKALLSTSVTLRPEVIATVEKLFPAESSVISLPAPAARVVVPVTAKLPLSVIAPAVVTFKVPDMVDAPRSKALASVSTTAFPLVIATVLKLLEALFKVMLLPAPEAKVVAPVTLSAPL